MVNPQRCLILVVSEFSEPFLKAGKVSLAW